MQKSIFQCDKCKKEIGLKPHISLVLNRHPASGIAVPPLPPQKTRWTVDVFEAMFVHFCSAPCISAYFNNLLKAAVASAKGQLKTSNEKF